MTSLFEQIVIEELDKLANLEEQAISRNDAETRVTTYSRQITIHLIKIVMFGPKCRDYNHWISEVDNWLTAIDKIRLKPKSYRMRFKDVQQWARLEYLDEHTYLNDVVGVIDNNEEYIPIGQDITRNNFITFSNMYDKILASCCNGKYSKEFLKATIKTEWFDRFKDTYK